MIKKKTENNLKECYSHIKPYIKDCKELKELCSNCEFYCGKDHNYEECENKICFKCWLALKYLEWYNSY